MTAVLLWALIAWTVVSVASGLLAGRLMRVVSRRRPVHPRT